MFHCIKSTLAALLLVASPLAAAELETPKGDIILTVSGAISGHNDGSSAVFDAEMLMSLPSTEITTQTIWTEGPQVFVGVSLADLLAHVGATGTSLAATAINDYSVEIPTGEIEDGVPILAYLMNGETMSVRDKGPLWVIYPYDSDPMYQSEVIYSRSIWQLDRIVVNE